ncbi:transposase family protein [Streptomyces sp. NPDC001415]
MTKKWARGALTHPAFCGVSRAQLGDLIAEWDDLWLARCESELRERRCAERQREAGAGPKHDLVFTDRLLATLALLRAGLPHGALAELYGIARSTISRVIGEIRPLLAMRGFAVPDHSGVRLRTLRTCSPMPRPRGSGCGSMAPRPRFAARRQADGSASSTPTPNLRQWRPLQRYTGPREGYAATHQAIASLVSDRSARRPTRRKPSTELVLARQVTC